VLIFYIVIENEVRKTMGCLRDSITFSKLHVPSSTSRQKNNC
jgi:hypothetical protein